MNATEFCYWLQGYVEMGGTNPSPEQWEMIKAHLGTVFNKVIPPLNKGWEDKKVDIQKKDQDKTAPIDIGDILKKIDTGRFPPLPAPRSPLDWPSYPFDEKKYTLKPVPSITFNEPIC